MPPCIWIGASKLQKAIKREDTSTTIGLSTRQVFWKRKYRFLTVSPSTLLQKLTLIESSNTLGTFKVLMKTFSTSNLTLNRPRKLQNSKTLTRSRLLSGKPSISRVNKANKLVMEPQSNGVCTDRLAEKLQPLSISCSIFL